MGILGTITRVLSSLRPSDEQLATQHETLRLRYVSTQDVAKATKLQNILHGLDNEMIRRANRIYERENPNAQTRHREHGWYLDNDD